MAQNQDQDSDPVHRGVSEIRMGISGRSFRSPKAALTFPKVAPGAV
jgi:hypothetical protein